MARDDFYASVFGSVYSAYMERPWLARIISPVVWGGDLRPYYEGMSSVEAVREGGTVVECPCGAGPALRAVKPDRQLRYVAVDLSPSMLVRAQRRAERRAIRVEFVRSSATSIPLADESADLFLSFWGLHCFDDPAAAIGEVGRVLTPGGRLVGATFVRGDDSLRQRLLIRPGTGDFGSVPTEGEVESCLAAEGLVAEFRRYGPMLYFEALRKA